MERTGVASMEMSLRFVTVLVLLGCAVARASVDLNVPQRRPGTYADSYALQAVGRVQVSSDGKFFVYEWGRPYLNWAPDLGWIRPRAASRLQTFLFVVDLTNPHPSSEYLFYPNAGCTYWLGDLSPDNKRVILFELNHDERAVRAGVWSVVGRHVTWFTPRADEERLDKMTAWLSNDEFIFPVVAKRDAFVRASMLTHQTEVCVACTAATVRSLRAVSISAVMEAESAVRQTDMRGIPQGAKFLAGTVSGSLAVFEHDAEESLSLLYKQRGLSAVALFNNSKQWKDGADLQ
jgi:hypothetical protein